MLILQLRMELRLSSVMGEGGGGLVFSSPERPGEDKGFGEAGRQEEAGEKRADFRDGGDQAFEPAQAACALAGLVSFALPRAEPKADRRRSAASLARKAAAAMTSVIWRCQPCQERASQ